MKMCLFEILEANWQRPLMITLIMLIAFQKENVKHCLEMHQQHYGGKNGFNLANIMFIIRLINVTGLRC